MSLSQALETAVSSSQHTPQRSAGRGDQTSRQGKRENTGAHTIVSAAVVCRVAPCLHLPASLRSSAPRVVCCFSSSLADAATRTQVETWLKEQERTQFPSYIHSLVVELGTAARPLAVRQLAGITLKNTVNALDPQSQLVLEQRWKALPDPQRAAVKSMLLQILPDVEKQVRSTAALVSCASRAPQARNHRVFSFVFCRLPRFLHLPCLSAVAP